MKFSANGEGWSVGVQPILGYANVSLKNTNFLNYNFRSNFPFWPISYKKIFLDSYLIFIKTQFYPSSFILSGSVLHTSSFDVFYGKTILRILEAIFHILLPQDEP